MESLADSIQTLADSIQGKKSFDDDDRVAILGLLKQVLTLELDSVRADLEKALNAVNWCNASLNLISAGSALSRGERASTNSSASAAVAVSPGPQGGDNIADSHSDSEHESVGASQKATKVVTPTTKREVHQKEVKYEWCQGSNTVPTDGQLRAMKEHLEGVSKWSTCQEASGIGIGTTVPSSSDTDDFLLTVTVRDSVYVWVRHLILYTCKKYHVLPKSQMNLDIKKSRDLPIMDNTELQKRLGFVRLDEAGIKPGLKTMLGLIDNYVPPAANGDKRGVGKRKILFVRVEGKSDKQIRDTPAVTYTNLDDKEETVDLSTYIETVLLPALKPETFAPKYPKETGAASASASASGSKPKPAQGKARAECLSIPKSLCIHKEPGLDALVQFLEHPLPSETLQWFKDTVLKYQEIRDQSILEKLRQGVRPKHVTFKRAHVKKCVPDKDGNLLHCPYDIAEKKCVCDHCPGPECKDETLLAKSCWYLLDLCDTVDPLTGTQKDREKICRDTMKVHAHSNRSQPTTMQKSYKVLREFCEWYQICQYDLTGTEMFKEKQAVCPGLLYSTHLPELVGEWIGSIPDNENSPNTKHNKIKAVLDIVEGGAASTFLRIHQAQAAGTDADWLGTIRTKNMDALNTLLKKYKQDGSIIQQNTRLRLSSRSAGKAPQFTHISSAFKYHRTGIWSKVRAYKSSGMVPVVVQWFVLLGLIQSLLGARPGMYGHMAFGANLKTIGMLLSNDDVDHQRPKRKGSSRKGKKSQVDKEDLADSYSKGMALEYKQLMKDRVPEQQLHEFKYYVFLEALTKKRYGYKNGHINARILPFNRHRSILFIVYAASVLYVRKNTPEDVAVLAGEFLQNYEDTGYDTTKAYLWLEDKKVDFIALLCEHHGPTCRVFYRKEEDFVYPMLDDPSAEHITYQNGINDNISTLVQNSMKEWYDTLQEKDMEIDELCDGKTPHLSQKAVNYTVKYIRSATADHISRLFPDMDQEVKKMLVEQTMMHTLETHNSVYIKDLKYMRCAAASEWFERGAPQEEYNAVIKKTRSDMKVMEGVCFKVEVPGELNHLGGLGKERKEGGEEGDEDEEDDPPAKRSRLDPPAKIARERGEMEDDDDEDDVKRRRLEIPLVRAHTTTAADRRASDAKRVNSFLHSLRDGDMIEIEERSNVWEDYRVTSTSSETYPDPYATIKKAKGRKPAIVPETLIYACFEALADRVRHKGGKTWRQHAEG